MTTPKPQPVEHVRFGAIRAAVWKNTDKEGRVRFNTTIERLYTDEKGDWQSTTSFGRDDLLTLAKVADHSHTRVCELLNEQREADRTAAAPSTEAVATQARQR